MSRCASLRCLFAHSRSVVGAGADAAELLPPCDLRGVLRGAGVQELVGVVLDRAAAPADPVRVADGVPQGASSPRAAVDHRGPAPYRRGRCEFLLFLFLL